MQGYYHFWMHIEEIGFEGEALLEYSGRLTATQIDEESAYEGSYAWFHWNGGYCECDWEYDCRPFRASVSSG